MWALSLGPEAEVFEPEELRRQLRESLEKTMGRYVTTKARAQAVKAGEKAG